MLFPWRSMCSLIRPIFHDNCKSDSKRILDAVMPSYFMTTIEHLSAVKLISYTYVYTNLATLHHSCKPLYHHLFSWASSQSNSWLPITTFLPVIKHTVKLLPFSKLHHQNSHGRRSICDTFTRHRSLLLLVLTLSPTSAWHDSSTLSFCIFHTLSISCFLFCLLG